MISIQKKDVWLGCALFLLLLVILISPWDYAITQWLGAHALVGFAKFMDSSFFEGASMWNAIIPF